jgi:lipopolysaccharide transport system permease protein
MAPTTTTARATEDSRRSVWEQWRYGELLRTLLHRELRGRYRDSLLGALWMFVQPLVMTGVYYLVFSLLWKNDSIPNYPLFILIGMIAWNFFATSVVSGCASVLANGDIVKKVWFPRALLPLSVVLAQAITAGVLYVVFLPLDLWLSPSARWTFLLAIPVFLLFTALLFGMATLLATATVFFRDVQHLVGVAIMPLFFLTPIFYDFDSFPAAPPDWLVMILRYGNPVTPFIESLRAVLLQGVVPGPSLLVYCLVVGPAFALAGLWVMRRREDQFVVEM